MTMPQWANLVLLNFLIQGNINQKTKTFKTKEEAEEFRKIKMLN